MNRVSTPLEEAGLPEHLFFKSLKTFFKTIFVSFFTGIEGELQLWTVLSAVQRESWQVPGRGTAVRGLSVQRTRRVFGGKLIKIKNIQKFMNNFVLVAKF